MRIAVIGGGIFGCTVAIHATRAGHDVHLYESRIWPLTGATGHNQFRLHMGYHYPRSPETVQECREGLDSFLEEYGDCVVHPKSPHFWLRDKERHIYAIASEGSKTTGEDYLRFLKERELPYQPALLPDVLNHDVLDVAVEVPECRFNVDTLRNRVEARLRNVYGKERFHRNVHYNRPVQMVPEDLFDKFVIAAYADTNKALATLECPLQEYQFEVCEKPVVRMPPAFTDISVVIMDGPFGCVDPTSVVSCAHQLGHVEYAIRHSNVGYDPEVPEHLKPHINTFVRVGADMPSSNFNLMQRALARFIPAMEKAEHLGSMFTIRAVLPHRDDTDERPTIVEELDDKVIRVFSGKIPTCVDAARQVVGLLDERVA